MDVERPSSLRLAPTTTEGCLSRPSHTNGLQSSLAASPQAGIPMPKRPPSVRLGRSASLSAIPVPPPLRRQSSLVSNHSLKLHRLTGCHMDGPSAANPLSSEHSYVLTPTSNRDSLPTDMDPSTPGSPGKLEMGGITLDV